MAAKLPPSATKAFKEINRVIEMGWIPIPEIGFGGNAAPGRMLEHQLNIIENNADSPDLLDWEIKFHGGNSLLTLFHKEPEPRGSVNSIVVEYGWPDDHGRTSFRHTLGGESPRGFKVLNEADRVSVYHTGKNDPIAYWLHNGLLNAAAAKLRRLILVEGDLQAIPRQVRYNSATAYWDFNLMGFCNALQAGTVYIDFDARTNGGVGSSIRNHGTKFRVHINDIGELYVHSKKVNI
jgi:hypothetical protein